MIRAAVILACHNGAPYLREQIASVFGQVDCCVHVYYSDDGSTDQSLNICKNMCGDEFNLNIENKKFGSAFPS